MKKVEKIYNFSFYSNLAEQNKKQFQNVDVKLKFEQKNRKKREDIHLPRYFMQKQGLAIKIKILSYKSPCS